MSNGYEALLDGFGAEYKVNQDGEVFRRYKIGWKQLFGYKKGNTYCLKLKVKDGKLKEFSYGRLIFEVFKRPIPKDYVIVHKNGDVSDNRLINLKCMPLSERSRVTGPRSRRIGVNQLDENGEVINSWPSVRSAGRYLHLNYQSVSDICHGRVKKPMFNLKFDRSNNYKNAK